MGLNDAEIAAFHEIKGVSEHDERQARIDSVRFGRYNAVINYGDILTKNERVHMTLWVTLKDGTDVEVVGEFVPHSIIY
jgi:hypothetical protein